MDLSPDIKRLLIFAYIRFLPGIIWHRLLRLLSGSHKDPARTPVHIHKAFARDRRAQQ